MYHQQNSVKSKKHYGHDAFQLIDLQNVTVQWEDYGFTELRIPSAYNTLLKVKASSNLSELKI
jgi:hypothetical protein